MIRVLHIVDEAASEDGVRLLSLLLRLMPTTQVQHEVVVIGRRPAGLECPKHVPLRKLGRRFGSALSAVLDLRRALRQADADVIHAVGSVAAAAILFTRAFGWQVSGTGKRGQAPRRSTSLSMPSAIGSEPVPFCPTRLIATVSDPAESAAISRTWRSLSEAAQPLNVICSSETIRRRVVEAGVPAAATTLIRPGVDFGELRAARERVRREDFGLPPTGRVLLTTSPPSRGGGQYYAVWAMAILTRIWPDARMLVPGVSREQRRLERLMSQIDCGHIYVITGERYRPAELLAVSDVLVAPPLEDGPTGWLPWAMAAGVPIVATAIPAVTEFIADRHNGFLCRAGEPLALAIRIRAALESGDLLKKCTALARDQAYEAFRAQRCVSEYLKAFIQPIAQSCVPAVLTRE